MLTSLLAFFEDAGTIVTTAAEPMQWGAIFAFVAAALAFIPAGIGSTIGVTLGGQAVAGVAAEKPDVYPKLQVIQLLPATQGIYGFIIAFVICLRIGVLGGTIAALTIEQGLQYIAGALPIAIVGYFSAVFQGKVGASAIAMVGKNPDMSGKGIAMVAVVETYAIFGLLVSFLMVWLGVAI
ncbi:MAG TPA: V-type ATP synthase subunit K [Eubacteriales bacterium]|nr:V-type ATP synthase subunit K [Eubacteriales bacterium]